MLKVSGSGEFEGNPYKASLKFKTTNIYLIDNDDVLGSTEKEEEMEFKIICKDNVEAGDLNKLFTSLKNNGVVLEFNGTIPSKFNSNSPFSSVILNGAEYFIKKYHKDMK